MTSGIAVDPAGSSRRQRLIATTIGLLLLIALVTLGAALVTSGRDFWSWAIAGYLFTVPFALGIWHEALPKDSQGPQSPADWLASFVLSAVLSGIFIAIDVAIVHPGLSLIFTLGALSMAFISLPSAARAWFLERRSANRKNGGRDA